MDIFERLDILTVFSVYALMVFKVFSAAFHIPIQYTIVSFSFASLKLLTNSENAY
jgi:hypothetical protein